MVIHSSWPNHSPRLCFLHRHLEQSRHKWLIRRILGRTQYRKHEQDSYTNLECLHNELIGFIAHASICTMAQLYRYDADELNTMAEGIVLAIKKYNIPVDQLTDQEIWEELQRKGYKFPFRGKQLYDYMFFLTEGAWWFEALHLALRKVRRGEGQEERPNET
jgi:hypothetical protein